MQGLKNKHLIKRSQITMWAITERGVEALPEELREDPAQPVLQQDPNGDPTDYILIGDGVWIAKDPFLLHIYMTDEGIVADVYPMKDFRDGDPATIASTYAFFSEAEDEGT